MFKNGKYKISIYFALVVLLLIILHGLRLLTPLENFLTVATQPISVRFYDWSSSLRNSYSANRDRTALRQQVSNLSAQVATLTVANSQCLQIQNENVKLRSALNFLDTNHFKAVVARIIARQAPTDEGNDILIDRGRSDGLQPGLGVVSETGVLIGKIVSVKDHSATLCLTTSANCQFAASILNQSQTQGITSGDLGLTIKMNYIPQLDKIAPGDMVITSGLTGDIPHGLLIGRISQVYNTSNEVWQSATIEPTADLKNLTVVSVILP